VVDAEQRHRDSFESLAAVSCHELLGHEEVQQLLNRWKSAPKSSRTWCPAVADCVVVKVLQYLLLERVPIRNLRTICRDAR